MFTLAALRAQTITYNGDRTVLTFTALGNTVFTVPAGVNDVDYVIVGGGGGGGSNRGGGGGAGGVRFGNFGEISSQRVYIVVVGGGGEPGGNGGNSAIANPYGGFQVVADGGGHGGGVGGAGSDGGSGGGHGAGINLAPSYSNPVMGPDPQGSSGGSGSSGSSYGSGGGGGGFGSAGGFAQDGFDAPLSNIGGTGYTESLTGQSLGLAGGGGGGVQRLSDSIIGGAAAVGFGGGKGSGTAAGGNATPNTGGGGGGGGAAVVGTGYDGGSGGSGIVILSYLTTNNDFAHRRSLGSSSSPETSGSNVGANKEEGEPSHPDNVGGASVWWTWTAPSTGIYRFRTSGSSINTLLAIYTGNTLNALTLVASNDDFDCNPTSLVEFPVVAGTTYQICVDGRDGETGSISLSGTLINSAPLLDPVALFGFPGESVPFRLGDAFSDPDEGELAGITIVTLPASGTLTLAETPVTAGQFIPVNDIGYLVYYPAEGATGAHTFTITASDGVLASELATVTVTIVSGASSTNVVSFPYQTTINTWDLASFVDNGAVPVGATVVGVDLSVEYSTYWPSSNPAISGNGVAVNGQDIGELGWASVGTGGDWNSLTRRYRGPLPAYNVGATNQWTIGSAWNPTNLRNVTFTVYYTLGNRAPSLTPIAVNAVIDTTYAFSASVFTTAYSDPEATPLASITLETEPTSGTLKLSGVAVTKNQVIPAASLSQLTYEPASGATGAKTFTVSASDGTASSAPATVTITLAPPPDVTPPTLTAVSIASNNSVSSAVAKRGNTVTVTFTASEALALPGATLRGWYPLDGNGLDPSGTGPTLEQPGGAVVFTEGLVGGAASFDGSGSSWLRAQINASGDVNPTFSWGGWVKLTNASQWGILFSNDNDGWDRFTTANNGMWAVTLGGFLNSPYETSTQWTFVAQSFDGTTQKLYVDDHEVFTATDPGNQSMQSFIDIGRNANGAAPANALFDGVFFFDEVLTPQQIATIRSGGPGGSGVLAVGSPGAVATINGQPAVVSQVEGNIWKATRVLGAEDLSGPVTFSIAFSDTAGNPGAPVTATTDGSAVTLDATAPEGGTVTLPAAGTYAQGQTISFTVTYSEPVTVTGTPRLTAYFGESAVLAPYFSGSGTNQLVFRGTIPAGIQGSLGLAPFVVNGTLTDAVGNTVGNGLFGTLTSSSVLVDTLAPVVFYISRLGESPTGASSVTYELAFFEPVTGVDATDFTLTFTGATTGAVTNVSGSGASYTITVGTVGGAGTLRLDLKSTGTGIADLAGNALVGGFTDGEVYAITNGAPSNTAPASASVLEDGSLAFTGGNALSVADADGNIASVHFETGHGKLAVSLAGGATISSGANNSSSLTLAGSTEQLNAALATLVYAPDANYSGPDALLFQTVDTGGLVASNTINLTVTPVNDTPSLGAGSLLVYETVTPTRVEGQIAYSVNNAAALAGVPFSRVRYRMELTVGGVARYADVSFDAWEGLTVAGLQVPSASNPFSIQRNVTNLSVASNYPGVVNATGQVGRLEIWPYSYTEQANGGVGGDGSRYDFDDRASDDPNGYGSFQVHNLTAGPQTVFAWNRHNGPPEIGFGNSPTQHPDWTFSANEAAQLGTDGWKLQVYIEPAEGAQNFTVTEDTVSNLQFSGVPFADIDSSSVTVTLSVPDGTLTGNSGEGVAIGGTPVARTFSGSVAALNAYFTTAGKITYLPPVNQTASRALTIAITDGALSAQVTGTITILPVNDAPVLAPVAVSGTEGVPVTFTAENFTAAFSDVDSPALVSLTVASVPATGTLLLSGVPVNASQVILAAQLGNLSYVPAPFENGPKTFTVTVSDGETSSAPATVTMTLAPVNDAPVNTAPVAVSLAEDSPFLFTGGNAVGVVDFDGNLSTVRLTVLHGTLAVNAVEGATISAGANNSATLTLSGSPGQINSALSFLVYTPAADYHGSDTLTIVSTDSTALVDTDTVAITISPVADIVADDLVTNEDIAITANVLTGTNGASADNFEGAATLTAVTQGAHGTVTFTAAGAVTYTPASNYNGPDSFTYTVTSGGVTETATVTVTVNPVNDAPVNGVPVAQSTPSNTPLVFSPANSNALTVADVDAAALTVTLTATQGTVTLSTTAGLSFSLGTGSGETTMRFTGPLANLNAALSGLVFTPTAAFSGAASLTILTADNGSTGSGGSLTDSDTVAITVTDSIPPTVLGLDSATSAGHYRAGGVIDVRVTFSEPVAVNTAGGTPSLLLETGAVDRAAVYLSGSGTTVLVFRYTVAAGDTTDDLNHQSTAALSLNGGVIADLAGNPATLTLPATAPGTSGALATNAAFVIDTTAPTVAISSPSVANTTTGPVSFTITYSDTYLAAPTLLASDIALVPTVAGPGLVAPSGTVAVSGSGTTRTVTISGITGDGTLAISVAAGTASDLAGNTAAAAGPSATFGVQNTYALNITTQPLGTNVAVGMPLTLSVGVQGSTPAYQWLRDGTPIVGATNATYQLGSTPLTASGVYTVVVNNALGAGTSNPATVTVFDVAGAHTTVGFGYVAGQTLTLRNTLTFTGGDGTFAWSLLLPPGWTYVSDDGTAETRPAVGASELLEWQWLSFPLSPVVVNVQVRAPANATGPQVFAAQIIFTRQGATVPLLAKPDPLVVTEIPPHSADLNRDGRIDLPELLRVIELYNVRNLTVRTGAYAVQSGTEDGFAPAHTRSPLEVAVLTSYHSADSDHDGRIDLFELSRVIELFNYRVGTVRTGELHRQTGTEDGYASGPAP